MTPSSPAPAPTGRPGSTGSRLVLGTAQLGQRYGIANSTGRPSRAAVRDVLAAAQSCAIGYLDTARAYGDSEAEIGREAPPGPTPAVITKIAPVDLSDPVGSFRRSIRASRSALADKAGDITDLLLHRAADARLPEVWSLLRSELGRDGIVRIGVSVQSPAELLNCLRLPEIGHVQLPLNVLDRRWLDPAVDAGLGERPDVVVVTRSVLLQGLLAAGSSVAWPAGQRPKPIIAALDRVVAEAGLSSRAELCVRFVLGVPWVSAVVIGAESPEQVRNNASLVACDALPEHVREAVLERVPAGELSLVDPARWAL